MPDLYELSADVLGDNVRVAAFRGTEGLSQLYELTIGVIVRAEQPLDMAGARGFKASLKIDSEHTPFVFHGMIASVALLHAWQGQALYKVVVVPRVWALTMTHQSRVFVDMSIPDIITAMLEESGIDSSLFELRLNGTYEPELHVCQYKESRWDFIARLMEREGIYFFFEHGDSDEKLVIVDDKSAHGPLRSDPVRYVPLSGTGDGMSSEALGTFTAQHRSLPQNVLVRDYDHLKPKLDVKGEATIWDNSSAERKTYGNDSFLTPDQGNAIATRRAEAWLAQELTYRGRGRVLGLRSGYRMELDEHPVGDMNAPYLVVALRHVGVMAAELAMVREFLQIDRTDDYHVEVSAIGADVQYRPPRVTPNPRIFGLERGFIDGPEDSEYAQIDENGRYKVKLHFDIDDSDEWDGGASTWVRMLQPHGGTTEGFHFPLRKNTEVLIAFLGADPDRPVIVGAVPNTVQPSPVTSDNHTQNVIQTGSENRIEIEDQKPKQYIDISTPPMDTRIHLGEPHGDHSHYIVEHTDGNELIDIGGTRDIEVGGDQNEHVVGNVNEYFDADHNMVIGGSQDIDVGGVRGVDVGGQQDHKIGGPVTETYDASHTTVVAATRLEQVGGHVTENYGAGQTSNITGAWSVNTSGSLLETVGGSAIRDVSGGVQVLGSTIYFNAKGTYDVSAGGAATFFVGGATNINSNGPFKVTSATREINSGYTHKVAVGAETNITASAKANLVAAAEATAAASIKVEMSGGLTVKLVGGIMKETTAMRKEEHAAKNVTCASYSMTTGAVTFTCASFTVL